MDIKLSVIDNQEKIICDAQPALLQSDNLVDVGNPSIERIHVLVSSTAFSGVYSHTSLNLSHEVGGFLIGKPYNYQNKIYVEIIDLIIAVASSSSATHLTWSGEIWGNAFSLLREKFPGNHIIGWYHTHPRMGVFLSRDDLFLHECFFREAWQVALVVDPVRKKADFFIWDNADVRKSQGYQVTYPPHLSKNERWTSEV